MKRFVLLASLCAAFALVSTSAEAKRTPRACLLASKTAKEIKKIVADVKRRTAALKRAVGSSGKFRKLHFSARTKQKPIVYKYASHFKQPSFRSKWDAHKLRKRHVRKSFVKIFFKFKLDFRKLKQKGLNLDKLKQSGFKFKKSSLWRPRRDVAPCGIDRRDGPCVKAKLKLSSSFKKHFSKKRLTKMYNIKTFLKFFTKSTIKQSIDKTKQAIAEGRKLVRQARSQKNKLRSLRRKLKSLRSKFNRYRNQCKRALRRRTSIDRSPHPLRRCGLDAPGPQAPVCWICNSWSGVDGAITDGINEVGSFEGNFLTADAWLQTDEAYNAGAQSAYDAQNVPGL